MPKYGIKMCLFPRYPRNQHFTVQVQLIIGNLMFTTVGDSCFAIQLLAIGVENDGDDLKIIVHDNGLRVVNDTR